MVASHGLESKVALSVPPVSPKAAHSSAQFLGHRDDDPRRASHVADQYLSSYWATSPTRSTPLARRRASVSSPLSTVKVAHRRPSALDETIRSVSPRCCVDRLRAGGVWADACAGSARPQAHLAALDRDAPSPEGL
jgi:hypothetical protein